MADPGQGHDKSRHTDGDTATVVDETVSRAYRELARERPPAALDERIRGRARRAPPARPWQRPLAIAATLALAVALVLQVATPPDGGQPSPLRQSAPHSPVGDTLPEEAAVPAYALQPDRADAGQAVSELGRASRKAAQSLAGKETATASTHCTDHVGNADAWLACIAELEAAGEQAAAERERQAWTVRHGPEPDPAD
ncbi:hypothetical protein [Lentisalinibacter sediminis]|uniref:hypothetical protein n=1 Tax=Lentisalinibacter sediminis TaxID=2992237 RepID=UPI003870EC4E